MIYEIDTKLFNYSMELWNYLISRNTCYLFSQNLAPYFRIVSLYLVLDHRMAENCNNYVYMNRYKTPSSIMVFSHLNVNYVTLTRLKTMNSQFYSILPYNFKYLLCFSD